MCTFCICSVQVYRTTLFHVTCHPPKLTHPMHFCLCMIILTPFSVPLFLPATFFSLFCYMLSCSLALFFSDSVYSQVLLALLTCQTPETCS